jgi:hypothetical protein
MVNFPQNLLYCEYGKCTGWPLDRFFMSLILVKPTIEELRELIGGVISDNKERSSFSLYPQGFVTGTIIELIGSGKTQSIALFLNEHPTYKVAWIEDKISINPYALFQMGIKLENILFIEAKKEIIWCLDQAMQSGCFKVLITQTKKISEKDLRRYQLGAEKNHSHFFLLSDSPHASWVPQLQLRINKNKSKITFEVVRKRGLG